MIKFADWLINFNQLKLSDFLAGLGYGTLVSLESFILLKVDMHFNSTRAVLEELDLFRSFKFKDIS